MPQAPVPVVVAVPRARAAVAPSTLRAGLAFPTYSPNTPVSGRSSTRRRRVRTYRNRPNAGRVIRTRPILRRPVAPPRPPSTARRNLRSSAVPRSHHLRPGRRAARCRRPPRRVRRHRNHPSRARRCTGDRPRLRPSNRNRARRCAGDRRPSSRSNPSRAHRCTGDRTRLSRSSRPAAPLDRAGRRAPRGRPGPGSSRRKTG
jgi:hypothetical protein